LLFRSSLANYFLRNKSGSARGAFPSGVTVRISCK
jgi:hypothetical protein